MDHHSSHRSLLHQPAVPAEHAAAVDAIVVPTARRLEHLRAALASVRALGCPVLALCSGRAEPRHVVEAARDLEVQAYAVRMPARPPLPRFGTTAQPIVRTIGITADTSAKRNLGLLVARMAGLRRIVFLDDDIVDIRPQELRDAAYLLDTYEAVGLRNTGYPDNSVVCHAYRATGGAQGTFIGAGALAVRVDAGTGFFPSLFNEDWLFLFDALRHGRVAVTGTVAQQSFDPFATPHSARLQEFGDCLGEGLYWLLDLGRDLDDASLRFWADFLAKRRRFIREIIVRLTRDGASIEGSDRMVESLKAASAYHHRFGPQDCVDYLAAWAADRRMWTQRLGTEDMPMALDTALKRLRLNHFSTEHGYPPAVTVSLPQPPSKASRLPYRPRQDSTGPGRDRLRQLSRGLGQLPHWLGRRRHRLGRLSYKALWAIGFAPKPNWNLADYPLLIDRTPAGN